MEFPHGMFDDFDHADEEIFARMQNRIAQWSAMEDVALVFPMAFKEHIDHFIVREAAVAVAKEVGPKRNAAFYFQEDKPYGGISDSKELARIDAFIKDNTLEARTYTCDPQKVIDLAFKHYISQVEEVYKTGIRERSRVLKEQMKSDEACDRIYLLP